MRIDPISACADEICLSDSKTGTGCPFATAPEIPPGQSFNLDFHSAPYFGEHPLVESHYLPKRSRRQPSIPTFLAQDADSQVFCYSNADIRKGEEADEVFRFIDFCPQAR